jgi:hypothetical protein
MSGQDYSILFDQRTTAVDIQVHNHVYIFVMQILNLMEIWRYEVG